MKRLNLDVVSQWFYGFFFLCFNCSEILGNLISSFVLSGNGNGSSNIPENGTNANRTHCGANFCPAKQHSPLPSRSNGSFRTTSTIAENTVLGKTGDYHMEILTGIFLACSVVAAFVIIIGVDSLKRWSNMNQSHPNSCLLQYS